MSVVVHCYNVQMIPPETGDSMARFLLHVCLFDTICVAVHSA